MLQHKFVEFIPDRIEDGLLYISVQYCTAIHKCVCGCGNEVVTPLSPTDWRLTFDGISISLYPSIGNWNFDCQSHYWIKNNLEQKREFYKDPIIPERKSIVQETKNPTLWQRLLKLYVYRHKFRSLYNRSYAWVTKLAKSFKSSTK